jgi:tellurite resistance protein
MHEQDLAIIRALVPVAWADGVFAEQEKQILDALLDAYDATDAERRELREYAAQKRTLDDIDLQELSADDRRILLQRAVLICYADGDYSDSESKFLGELVKKLRLPEDEAKEVIATSSDRAKQLLKHLA